MSDPEPTEPAPQDVADQVQGFVESEPELAEQVRDVLHHLHTTEIDPTGAPE